MDNKIYESLKRMTDEESRSLAVYLSTALQMLDGGRTILEDGIKFVEEGH